MPQPDTILACLNRNPELDDAHRFVVAYSGGLDSTVLLDLTRRALPRRPAASLLAVHVDHDLHSSSQDWARHCAATARRFGVKYVSCRVRVDTGNGDSPEAAARTARYSALRDHIGPGDVLLNAHHRDDQVETVLLQLFRGAGVAGLAGMPELAAFATGWCLRPLLSVTRSQLLAYATKHSLEWVDDPSNAELRYDRNFLRQEIVPHLTVRWPGVPASIARSAQHCGAATHLLREVGATDVQFIAASGGSADLSLLTTLSGGRQDNALRYWIRKQNLPAPNTAHLKQVHQLMQASETVGCVSWPGAEVRRYRDRLYAMTPLDGPPANFELELVAGSVVTVPGDLGQLRIELAPNRGLDSRLCGQSLTVRFRAGGEKIRPGPGPHRRALRNLFQETGIVPWMRERIPLLYAGDRLVAVGDLWLEQDFAVVRGGSGLSISWENRPTLY